MEIISTAFTISLIWLILAIAAIFIPLLWLSPDEVRGKLKNAVFPDNYFMTALGFFCLYAVLPLTLPFTLFHVIKQVYKTYFK